jgi:hypothetical protein
VLPNPVLAALAGAADNAGKMPLTDFCNRPSARAPTESAGFPRCVPRRLAASPAQVRGRLTPSSQLRPGPRRPSCEGERRTERRCPAAACSTARSALSSTSDASLDARGLRVPFGALHPDRLDARLRRIAARRPSLRTPFDALRSGSPRDALRPNPSRPPGAPRVSRSFRRAWVASAVLPSRSPASATRQGSARASPSRAALGTCSRRSFTPPGGAFHRQVISRSPLARSLEIPPPSSRRCRLRAGFERPSLSRPLQALAQGSVSSARRPSTSAITTVREHDGGQDLPPRKPRRDRSQRGVTRAAALALRRAAGRAFSGPGAVVRLAAPPAPPLGEGSFAPTPMSSGTSCHRARVRTGRRACTNERDRGPHEPAGGRRKRRPLEGCFSPPSAKKGWMGAPEVPSVERPPRRAVHLDSTACDQPVEYVWRRLFYRRDILRR